MAVATVLLGQDVVGAANRLKIRHDDRARYWAAADGVEGAAFPLRRL